MIKDLHNKSWNNYKFNNVEMLKFIDEFNLIYSNRPIKDNSGGMKSAHLFPLFFYLKKANPKLIIESGVYKGQGTWLMRHCCPDSKIISIDINLTQIIFKDNTVFYYDKDITSINIDEIIDEFHSEEILLFFDDHQDFNKRFNFLFKNKIKHIIYEDNYPYNQGDCISPKKIIESEKFIVKDKEISLKKEEREFIIKNIKHYEEFPPIFKDYKTRWGNEWNYKTRESLLNDESIQKYQDFYKERFDYTWICYLELNKEN